MMSSWKDDLIKDHLKEDIENETENGESENEEAKQEVRIWILIKLPLPLMEHSILL